MFKDFDFTFETIEQDLTVLGIGFVKGFKEDIVDSAKVGYSVTKEMFE